MRKHRFTVWSAAVAVALLAGGLWGQQATTAPPGPAAPTATRFKFSFGPGKVPEGFVQVLPEQGYTAGKWGFEGDTKPRGGDTGGGDALTSHYIQGPFTFSVDLAEGNYRVTAHLGHPTEATVTTILAESRRLMVEKVETGAGRSARVTFIVNVRNHRIPPPPRNAPGGSEVRFTAGLDNPLTWDDKLTLTFTNQRPCVQAIEIEPVTVPTIFLAGDSTVTDQGRDPAASWGQMLPAFFAPEVAVANHATSGETLKSFVTSLRLEKILSQMKAGDCLLMQFGHNDEKQSWPQTYVDPQTTFKAYARVFIAEARRKGATVVLISPMERRGGTTAEANSHFGFPQAYRELAKEENVPLIDNWAASKVMYAAMGDDLAAAFGDQTHHRNYGAYHLARLVATGLRANTVDVARFLREDFRELDPARPDKLADFMVPMR